MKAVQAPIQTSMAFTYETCGVSAFNPVIEERLFEVAVSPTWHSFVSQKPTFKILLTSWMMRRALKQNIYLNNKGLRTWDRLIFRVPRSLVSSSNIVKDTLVLIWVRGLKTFLNYLRWMNNEMRNQLLRHWNLTWTFMALTELLLTQSVNFDKVCQLFSPHFPSNCRLSERLL